ncbi:MAG: alpha/beta hydrolase [Bacteroidales bacterium]
MKHRLYIVYTFLFLCCFSSLAQYTSDELGGKFVKRTIEMQDDYEGEVVCTLIKMPSDSLSHKAVLYIHGFNDYFFQKDMAAEFDSAGFNFYALDLRKYGRSYLPNQVKFNVRDLSEYFPHIDSALTIIQKEGNNKIFLMGHSTGGLITSLYAQARKANEPMAGLILNSPFLDQNQSWFKEKILLPIVSFLSKWFPDITINQGMSTAYGESLLKEHKGEWEYDETKKMMQSPPLTLSWLGAIYKGQKEVHRGLELSIPILVMHSDKSTNDIQFSESYMNSDAVLDVNDIDKYGRRLSSNVKMTVIPDGLHDLVLSRRSARDSTYRVMFNFLRDL